ncbi:MAG: hypothetical protein KJ558_05655 [Gammaproteobacteria bacterium]|nr:hypothetical protein [Gammaproteobacteria bacterium]MBU1654301.1 hypothetical protein [Gammaproteobacteria bacterium]MBU1961224.1 hypothetical protein [Gammaproteobacteria bacterium]
MRQHFHHSGEGASSDDRYSAFSFVDRIGSLEPGISATGQFQIPAGINGFPPSLVAEAIGQLAAWVSIDRLDYRFRPVAGIAAEVRFLRQVRPGQLLELAVEIDSCSESDVAYSGRALVEGEVAVELFHSLGPMLPMVEFDDPADVRERFRLLSGAGAPAGRFPGVPDIALIPFEQTPGKDLRARLRVPEAAPFFGDHFPRRPVFPATLLLNTQILAATRLALESDHWPADTPIGVKRVLDVKMRSFMPPGQELEVRVALASPVQGFATARMTTQMDGKRVAHALAEIGPLNIGI